jgi:hypothetical protein
MKFHPQNKENEELQKLKKALLLQMRPRRKPRIRSRPRRSELKNLLPQVVR